MNKIHNSLYEYVNKYLFGGQKNLQGIEKEYFTYVIIS